MPPLTWLKYQAGQQDWWQRSLGSQVVGIAAKGSTTGTAYLHVCFLSPFELWLDLIFLFLFLLAVLLLLLLLSSCRCCYRCRRCCCRRCVVVVRCFPPSSSFLGCKRLWREPCCKSAFVGIHWHPGISQDVSEIQKIREKNDHGTSEFGGWFHCLQMTSLEMTCWTSPLFLEPSFLKLTHEKKSRDKRPITCRSGWTPPKNTTKHLPRHSTTFKSIMQTLCYIFVMLVEATKTILWPFWHLTVWDY